jgi:hypothetical protein
LFIHQLNIPKLANNITFTFHRVEVINEEDTITTKEFFGEGKMMSNTLTLLIEAPFHYPDDKEGKKYGQLFKE